MDIKAIQSDIKTEWTQFEELLRESLRSDYDLLNQINSHLFDNKGKQIRPLLGLLAAKCCGPINSLTISCAVVSEMLHTASLLHDDVADEAPQRRGAQTVQYKFNPAASVLTGDYWLAKALNLLLKERDMSVLNYFTKTIEELSEGEIFQMQKASSLDTTEEDYYKIISAKTSSLFIASVKSMVYSTGASEKIIADMESYAYNLGLAFQIRDDIFDYTPQLNTGKPSGGDIQEKKLTLPLILALKAATEQERESLLRAIRFAEAEDEHIVESTFALVKKYSGTASAQKTLEEHCMKAEESLSGLKESIYKNHLIELTRFVGSRES